MSIGFLFLFYRFIWEKCYESIFDYKELNYALPYATI